MLGNNRVHTSKNISYDTMYIPVHYFIYFPSICCNLYLQLRKLVPFKEKAIKILRADLKRLKRILPNIIISQERQNLSKIIFLEGSYYRQVSQLKHFSSCIRSDENCCAYFNLYYQALMPLVLAGQRIMCRCSQMLGKQVQDVSETVEL